MIVYTYIRFHLFLSIDNGKPQSEQKRRIIRDCLRLKITNSAIVVGDPRVGKTTLVRKACQVLTEAKILPTVGIQFACTNLEHRSRMFKIKFWDLCTSFAMQLGKKNFPIFSILTRNVVMWEQWCLICQILKVFTMPKSG